MASVRKSLAISLTERYLVFGLQFISSLVLARLLTPHEFGVYSVAVVLMGFIHVVRDMGVGQYLVQEATLTRQKIRAVAGAVLTVSWLLAPVVFFAAGPVAAFYREPGLSDVLHVLALSLVIIPFGATVQAWLHRNMRFGALLVMRVGSTSVQIATSITLAWTGHGFMSLAWGSVAGVVATVLMANLYRPAQLRVLPSFRHMGGVFRFGGRSTAMGLLTELSAGLPEMIVGRTLGMEPVGVYNRARGQLQLFSRLFNASIFAVGLPHFARLHREGKSLAPDFRHGADCMLGVSWPLFAGTALFAEPLIRLLYGPQWSQAAALVPVMCVSAAVGNLLPLSHPLLMATGQVDRALQQIALQTVLMGIFLAVFSRYGLEVMVRANIGLGLIMLAWRYFTLRGWALLPGVLPAMIGRGALVTALAMIGPGVVWLAFGAAPAQPLVPLLLAAVTALPGWLLGLVLTGHPLASEAARLLGRLHPRLPVAWMLRRVATGG
jgi:O-antigen/teichoic acid export membrane protein